jgi:hypothetical protein
MQAEQPVTIAIEACATTTDEARPLLPAQNIRLIGAADWRVTVPPVWEQIWVICARPQSRLPEARSCRSMARAGSEAAWKA